jgi:hypothetical protein
MGERLGSIPVTKVSNVTVRGVELFAESLLVAAGAAPVNMIATTSAAVTSLLLGYLSWSLMARTPRSRIDQTL